MAITPSQWSHVLTIPESYTPTAATSGQTLVITESVIAKLSAGDQTTFWSNVQNGGGDVRICTDSAGTNQLPVEIVSLDNVAETCVIWTRKATYAGTGDLYVFIGKPGETQPAVADSFGRNAVWADYENSNHFDGSGSDSSGRSDASLVGSPPYSTGVIGSALSLDGATQYALLPNPSVGENYTISLWVKIKSSPTGIDGILSFRSSVDSGVITFQLDIDSSLIPRFVVIDGVGGVVAIQSTSPLTLNAWHKIAATRSGSVFTLYADGDAKNSENVNVQGFTNQDTFLAGARLSSGDVVGHLDCEIDEISCLNVSVDSDEVATEYANQNDPASFYGTPTIQTTGGGAVTADTAYTINAPTFTSSASVTLPAPIADASFTLTSPTFTASAGASLPQPIADGAFSIASPSFSASADASLPQPTANAAFTLNSPAFSASASATILGFSASVAYSVNAPTFAADAAVTLPNPTADVAYAIAAPTFSVDSTATLPQPTADAAFSLPEPTFAASATATQTGFNASVNFTLPAPTFSADAVATLPQPIADGNFSITAPAFSVVAIAGGIAIIVDNETNINMPALSTNINAPVLSNNVRI